MAAKKKRKVAGGGLRFKSRNWVILPNAVTATNLIFGFLAILISIDRARFFRPSAAPTRFNVAAWLVVCATLLDVLDGKLAKWTHSATAFGMKMDSFADGITFGLAPAILLGSTALKPGSLPFELGLAACGVYFLCAVMRLARFNTAVPGHEGFSGLPSPAAALTLVSYYLVFKGGTLPAWSTAILVGGTGLLMVSTVPYPGFKSLRKGELQVFAGIFIALALLIIPFGLPKVLFFAMFLNDVLFGWSWMFLRERWFHPAMPKKKAAL